MRAILITMLCLVVAPIALASDDVGKREYDSHCAACHGSSGKGDGPYAGMLNARIADLTAIQKNNGGVFPFDRVYQTIDGRSAVAAHGTREMPIWGRQYGKEAVEYYSDYLRGYNAESFVRGRILALVSYIYSLQAK